MKADLSRRNFMTKGAAIGATAGFVGMGLASAPDAIAATKKIARSFED
ncbi:twin-arginine translocation signal domain-containing protein [Vibrio parahaemolyticus]|nr:twin-arginine translocation signal domain-containing protein [Vibrio parahaemolyticus]